MIKKLLAKKRAKKTLDRVTKAQKTMIESAKALQAMIPGSTLTLIVNDKESLYEISKPYNPIDVFGRYDVYDN